MTVANPSVPVKPPACLPPATVALLVTLAACSRPATVETGPTARAERGRIERVVVATGTIEPEKEVEVRSRISGIVERVQVAAGDVVAERRPLVEIERDLLAAETAEARARLAGSRAALRYARMELDRAVTLRREGTVSQHERDDVEARYEGAAAAVARDEAALQSLDIQLGYATVVAPMAGRILDVDVKVGSAVASVVSVTGGTRLLTIAADDVLHVRGLVDENEITRVAVGQPARIRTEAHGERVFGERLRVAAADEEAILTASPLDALRQLPLDQMRGLLFVLGAATLVIGGVGILNMMLDAVQERRQEIGVRLAVGARRREILGQFFLETFAITGLGGLAGLALGLAGCWGLARLETPDLIPVPIVRWQTVALALGVATGIGLAAGLVPAWRAARVDPSLTLRAE